MELSKQAYLAGGNCYHRFNEKWELGVSDFSRLQRLSNRRRWQDALRGVRARQSNAVGSVRRLMRATVLVLVHWLSLACAGLLTRSAVDSLVDSLKVDTGIEELAKQWPMLAGLTLAYAVVSTARSGHVNACRELKQNTLSSLLLVSMLGLVVFRESGFDAAKGVIGLLAWGLVVGLVPASLATTRALFCRFHWWGEPVLVFGAGPVGQSVVATLRRRKDFGLQPVAVHDPSTQTPSQLVGVPVLADWMQTLALVEELGIRHAIVTAPSALVHQLQNSSEEGPLRLEELYIVPDEAALLRLLLSSDSLQESFGRARLVVPPTGLARLLKRVLDVTVVSVVGLVALPVLIAIAFAIKLTSRGPVIYGHRRIGQGGQEIQVWKFRSMVTNADTVLAEHLASHPEAYREWQATQKLAVDPRVTPLGAWLRKTSLDELPQLLNVLKGDMSLVGPRPIVRSECHHYGKFMDVYDSVPPGLSGLWQVSGRSETSYAQRVELDVAYVRNWSLWLDLCILARTIPSVLAGRGAV